MVQGGKKKFVAESSATKLNLRGRRRSLGQRPNFFSATNFFCQLKICLKVFLGTSWQKKRGVHFRVIAHALFHRYQTCMAWDSNPVPLGYRALALPLHHSFTLLLLFLFQKCTGNPRSFSLLFFFTHFSTFFLNFLLSFSTSQNFFLILTLNFISLSLSTFSFLFFYLFSSHSFFATRSHSLYKEIFSFHTVLKLKLKF